MIESHYGWCPEAIGKNGQEPVIGVRNCCNDCPNVCMLIPGNKYLPYRFMFWDIFIASSTLFAI